MPKVTIHYVGDIVGPTNLTIDDMTDEALAELRADHASGSTDILFLEGRTPLGTHFGGHAIKVPSITAIDVES